MAAAIFIKNFSLKTGYYNISPFETTILPATFNMPETFAKNFLILNLLISRYTQAYTEYRLFLSKQKDARVKPEHDAFFKMPKRLAKFHMANLPLKAF